MKTLYVLRHAQAVPETAADSDHERPLTERGRAEARLAAQHLAGLMRLPSLVLSSDATRAKTTAEACLAVLPQSTELVLLGSLYLAEPAAYSAALAAGGDPHDSVLVVGHNPGLEALVYVLTERSEHLATASLVEIDLSISLWSELSDGLRVPGRCRGRFTARA